jgi:HPt (histidine-containing phosphotransfer) domain-containing protein
MERSVDYEFDELKREFLAEAKDKVLEIETTLDGDRSPDRLDRLTYLAHQLKGSGGSYGFQRISTDAAELEEAVEGLAKGTEAARLEEKIQQHVVNLRAEIDKRSRELSASGAN